LVATQPNVNINIWIETNIVARPKIKLLLNASWPKGDDELHVFSDEVYGIDPHGTVENGRRALQLGSSALWSRREQKPPQVVPPD
jgi:hypothetical protein